MVSHWFRWSFCLCLFSGRTAYKLSFDTSALFFSCSCCCYCWVKLLLLLLRLSCVSISLGLSPSFSFLPFPFFSWFCLLLFSLPSNVIWWVIESLCKKSEESDDVGRLSQVAAPLLQLQLPFVLTFSWKSQTIKVVIHFKISWFQPRKLLWCREQVSLLMLLMPFDFGDDSIFSVSMDSLSTSSTWHFLQIPCLYLFFFRQHFPS